MHELGKALIVFGVILVAVGGLLFFSGKIPFFGRLPGDILIQKKNLTVYFPLATSFVISAVLSLVFWLLSKR